MDYRMSRYRVPNWKRTGREDELMYIHCSVPGAEGMYVVEKSEFGSLLRDMLGENMLEGSALFKISGGRRIRLPVYYNARRENANDSFYCNYGQFMKEYIPEYPSDEETYPSFMEKGQVFVKGVIIPFDGISEEDRGHTICQLQNGYWGIPEVIGIRLDPRDDFTVEELLALGTSMETVKSSIEGF